MNPGGSVKNLLRTEAEQLGRRELSGNAQTVVRRAWGLAEAMGHSWVGSEHLLLAILDAPQCLACRLLRWEGLGPEELTARLVARAGRGKPLRLLPQGFSLHARRAISQAEGAPVEPEHLLLALLREEDCTAVALLRDCGLCPDCLFTNLYEGLYVRKEQKMQNTRLLDQFGVDMIERADKTELVIGRKREIETVLQILSRRHKNNPALIGEPGVGKTAIVEGVAQYLAAGPGAGAPAGQAAVFSGYGQRDCRYQIPGRV